MDDPTTQMKSAWLMSESEKEFFMRNHGNHGNHGHHDVLSSFSWGELRKSLVDWMKALVPVGRSTDGPRSLGGAEDQRSPKHMVPDAEFIGWQEAMNAEFFPLYIVKAAHHPLYRSTVSADTLRKQGLRIPLTPNRREEQQKSF